ncbi:carboxypeptidase-like regulatory domain-containing protein [Sphingobacterium paludis]|uniref:TonB-like protein n=1 Tax=Sphingobacterium paludis TaxID=1476465 RepID=A0A4R7CWJ6_9SPHI|nr:carboxypeptidase-like regulatory domain-containing protein [Sphingobacterium paludis]TDS11062.1 TonB-like protein [Sphingobacterium paludis]
MQNRKFDIAYIRRYVRGELTPVEMHEVERAAEADEMLMDLILGVETEHLQQLPSQKEMIEREIAVRVSPSGEKTRVLPWRSLSVAASMLAVLGISAYIFLRSPQPQEHNIAVEKADRPVSQEHTPSPLYKADSIEPSNEQVGEASPQQLAARRPRITRNTEPTSTDILRDSNSTGDDLAKDSDALIVALAPSNALDAVEVTATRPARKQSGAGNAERTPIRGSSISLTTSNTAQAVVSGKVLDAETSSPLQHAVIKDLISNKTTSADSLGRFTLVSDSNRVNLTLNYVGYESKQLLAETSALEIRLNREHNSLDEVVVSSLKKSKAKAGKPKPMGGWRNFNAYIKNALTTAGLSSGTVVLTFDLDSHGRPVNIQIEKSVSTAHDAKAIRLLQDGPTWERNVENQPVRVKIEF